MKFVVLAMFTIMILFASSVEAIGIDSDKIFLEPKGVIIPSRHRHFVPPISIPHQRENIPRRTYPPRQSVRPTPHYQPNTPRATYDNRGGRGKRFVPQNPQR